MAQGVSDALKKLIDLKLVVPVVMVKVHKRREVFVTHYYDLHVKGGPLKGSLRECIKQIAVDNAVYHELMGCNVRIMTRGNNRTSL
jgi:hypothetical protein